MESDDEIRGKAYVHWRSSHEAFPGLVSEDYLDKLTLENCEKKAYGWTDNFIVAKENDRVIGFVGFGDRGEEAPNIGEIFALYVLPEYYGKGVGLQLMMAGLEQLKDYPQVCLWVLKENKRAVRFYQKCGFVPDGEELISKNVGSTEIRMVMKKTKAMPQDVMIRKAQKEDAESLAGLAILMWGDHDLHDLANEFRELSSSEESACFLKCVEERPIAFAQCQLRHDFVEGTDSSPVGYLEGIFVSEEYRRKGFAAELLAACENWAKKKGCTEFASDCELDNADSLRFHMAVGFTEANRIICFQKKL